MLKKKPKKLKIRLETTKKKINRVDSLVILEKRTEDEDKERKKLLLLRAGVAGSMVIFFAAWIFSLKYQFKTNENNNNKNSFNWEQTKAELDQVMSQVKQGLKEIKQIQAARPVNTLPRETELTSEQLDLLKEKLMEETASGTEKNLK